MFDASLNKLKKKKNFSIISLVYYHLSPQGAPQWRACHSALLMKYFSAKSISKDFEIFFFLVQYVICK